MSIHRLMGAALLAIGLLSLSAFSATADPPVAGFLNYPLQLTAAGNAHVGTGIFSNNVTLVDVNVAMTVPDPDPPIEDPGGEGGPNPPAGGGDQPEGGWMFCGLEVSALPYCIG